MAAQATDEQRREIATHLLDNGGDRAHLEAQVAALWSDLTAKAQAKVVAEATEATRKREASEPGK
jgi:dephospho-CoA kinase